MNSLQKQSHMVSLNMVHLILITTPYNLPILYGLRLKTLRTTGVVFLEPVYQQMMEVECLDFGYTQKA